MHRNRFSVRVVRVVRLVRLVRLVRVVNSLCEGLVNSWCIVLEINYTPAMCCYSVVYMLWCIVCGKIGSKKTYRCACVRVCARNTLSFRSFIRLGSWAKTTKHLEKITKHLEKTIRHLVFSTKHLVIRLGRK